VGLTLPLFLAPPIPYQHFLERVTKDCEYADFGGPKSARAIALGTSVPKVDKSVSIVPTRFLDDILYLVSYLGSVTVRWFISE
jgi:hypothetical protein